MKKQIINIPIFNQEVQLLVGDLTTITNYISDIHSENIRDLIQFPNSTDAACFTIDGCIYLWWEEKFSIPLIAHEVLHAVYNICEVRGINISDQEILCYLLQYIMEQILNSPLIQMAPTNLL